MDAKKRKSTPADVDAAMRIGRVYAQRPWPGFAAVVLEYRQIEAELIQQAGDDDFIVLETKRRIAEWIVKCAWRDDVPFEQFQVAWNDLLELGFTDAEKKREMVFYWADYCLDNDLYDLGLAEIEPVIAEFEQWLQAVVLKPKQRAFYESDIKNLKFLREGLIALRTGGDIAEDWLARDDARGPTPEQKHRDELINKLFGAMKKIADKTSKASFAEVEQQYRQLETEFRESLQPGDESFAQESKRRITQTLFHRACELHEPFDVCRDLWNTLLSLDFGDLEHKCVMTRRYAECCLFHGQTEVGLAVVESLLGYLQHQVSTGTDEDMGEDNYPKEIGLLEKLRDALQAGPT